MLAEIEETEAPLAAELEETESLLQDHLDTARGRLNRLQEGCQAISGYSGEVDDLVWWLREFEPRVNPGELLSSCDPKEIKSAQGELIDCYGVSNIQGVW